MSLRQARPPQDIVNAGRPTATACIQGSEDSALGLRKSAPLEQGNPHSGLQSRRPPRFSRGSGVRTQPTAKLWVDGSNQRKSPSRSVRTAASARLHRNHPVPPRFFRRCRGSCFVVPRLPTASLWAWFRSPLPRLLRVRGGSHCRVRSHNSFSKQNSPQVPFSVVHCSAHNAQSELFRGRGILLAP